MDAGHAGAPRGTPARSPMRRSTPTPPGRSRTWIVPAVGALLLGLPPGALAQGPCLDASFAASSPYARTLNTFTPAAQGEGVIVHARVESGDSARAHLVVENTNPHPVEVRFDAEMRGSAGTITLRGRCIRVRAHEFAQGRTGSTLLPYPGAGLVGVRVVGLRTRDLAGASEGPVPALPERKPDTRVQPPRGAVRPASFLHHER